MALLGEELVEEWLNRNSYFTIRGLKRGVSEIDLLAIKNDAGEIDALHVEVQMSFNPVTYISPLSRKLTKVLNKNRRSALSRSIEQLDECVDEWVTTKFFSEEKMKMRDGVWSGLEWKYILVHGVVKHPEELDAIAQKGIKLIPLQEILSDLLEGDRTSHSSTGADLVDLILYYSSQKGQ
jgi:hypothetical protein